MRPLTYGGHAMVDRVQHKPCTPRGHTHTSHAHITRTHIACPPPLGGQAHFRTSTSVDAEIISVSAPRRTGRGVNLTRKFLEICSTIPGWSGPSCRLSADGCRTTGLGPLRRRDQRTMTWTQHTLPPTPSDKREQSGVYLGHSSTWYSWKVLENMGRAIGRAAPIWALSTDNEVIRWAREVAGEFGSGKMNGPQQGEHITGTGVAVNGRAYSWDQLEQMAKKYRMASHPRQYGNNDDRLQAAQALVAYDLGQQQGERIMKDKQAGRPLGSDGAYPGGVVVEGKLYQWADLHKWAKEYGVDSDDPALEDSLTWARAVLSARANQPTSGTTKVVREVRVGKGILAGRKPKNSTSTSGATIDGVLYEWEQIEGWGDALGIPDPSVLKGTLATDEELLEYSEEVVRQHKAKEAPTKQATMKRERRLTQREKMDRADWANPIEKGAPWWRYLRGFIVDGTVICAPCYVHGSADDRYSDEMTIPLVMTSPTNAGTYDFWGDTCSVCERPIAPTVAD